MSDSGIMVRLSGISKAYGEKEAKVQVLKGLDLEVRRGEMLAIVGPSGVGKSTLLYMVGLLDRADEGTVELDGQDAGALGGSERARLRNSLLGFVFQHHHLLDELDALDNVALPMRIAGKPAAFASRRAEGLLETVGLSQRMTHFPDQLSGGEQQRVAVARALVMRPGLLLADEPTGNLDRAASERVFGLIRSLHAEENLTSVIVTHNEKMADQCDRIFKLAPAEESSGNVDVP